MFMETEERKIVDTYRLEVAPNYSDEVKMYVQKVSGDKYTSGPFQFESSHFSSSTKTTFIQHGL